MNNWLMDGVFKDCFYSHWNQPGWGYCNKVMFAQKQNMQLQKGGFYIFWRR